MKKNNTLFLIGLLFLVLIACAVKLSLKDGQINVEFLGNVIRGQGAAHFIFFQMRLPAIIAAIAVSLLMVMVTFILQAISKNELADPSALGFNNIAITSLALMTLYIPETAKLPYTVLVILAALFVLLFALIMYRFAMTDERLNGTLLLLIGIGINSFFQMIITYIRTYSSDANDILSLMMQGNFDHLDLSYALIIFLLSLILVLFFFSQSTAFRLLQLDHSLSIGLGYRQVLFNSIFFMIMALSIALSLMLGASFPFVAFTAIHTMRKRFGKLLIAHFLASFLFMLGAVLISDILAHQLFATILPTSLFLTFFGSLGFVIVLLRRKNGNHS